MIIETCYVIIVFQVSLKFDPATKTLKIRYELYTLRKKVIILRKIQVIINIFAPPFFSHFCLSLNRKKRVVMKAMKK